MVSQFRGPAPIDPEALSTALRPFGQSRMLPREAYVDDAVFGWEQRHFLEGGWMCVARSDDIVGPGAQRAESVGRAGVFLVRADDGVVRGFANACRHRGHELLPCGESRRRPIVVCPYHSWSYRLDGTLRAAPGFDAVDGFVTGDHALVELPTAEWQGLLFIDPSGCAGPFADHVRGLEELVGPYEIERLRSGGGHDYVVQANWKVLCENYQECYHCATIHPQLCRVSPPRSGENYRSSGGGAWVGGWMALADEAETMSLDGTTAAGPLRGLDARQRREVIYLVIFPNVLLSLHPDYAMTHLLTPLAPDRTRVQCRWAFAPEDLDRPGFDPSYAVDFWDITNRQDWSACESVQRGLTSPHHVPGPLSPDEDGVYQYVTMVARGYRGLPLGSSVATIPGATRPGADTDPAARGRRGMHR
jgi:Rieske 2Fe-2S family protein